MEFLMRWTALLAKTVVAGAAGAFLAVSAAGAPPPRQPSDADAGRETPADERPAVPGPTAGARTASPGPTANERPASPGPTAGHLSP
ncbi:hypothetical protein ACFTUC_39210 [Streptomyces sp. NPDC056944]|uniref:hypothetical protein n=1 Tax=Streptomyces sp. NPDC056944 TaxID=3345972 RepID=UPI00364075E7